MMYFLIFWKEFSIFATVDVASCLGKERHVSYEQTTSKLIATVGIKLQYIKQPKPPLLKPFETKLNPWFVLLCTFGDDGVLGPPQT